MSEIILKDLSEPFHPNDIEWRVSQAEVDWCRIVPYLTARAVMARLDAVCGPENWHNTPLATHEMRVNVLAIQVGISIRINGEWITKYDVAEPTNIEPAKGGYSGAMKRAGAQWGIGRYLYHLTDMYGVIAEGKGKPTGYEWRKQKVKNTEKVYYWKPPALPAWALPRQADNENAVTKEQVAELKQLWRKKLAPLEKNRVALWDGFQTFVNSIDGPFHAEDLACWTQKIVDDVRRKLEAVKDGGKGPDASVPFE